MEVWEQLSKTNPKYTKPINKGWGTITTIDPMYQIKRMTNQFGPIGKGWSYHVNYHYTDKLVFAEVKIQVLFRCGVERVWSSVFGCTH